MKNLKMTSEERQLTERYLDNTLTGTELNEFLEKLGSDEEFRNEVSFYNLLVEGVRFSEDKRLTGLIESKINYHKPLIPFALKLILAFLFITTSGIVIWNYIGKDSAINNKYFSLRFLKKEKSDDAGIPIESDKTIKNGIPKKEVKTKISEDKNAGKIDAFIADSDNTQSDKIDEIEVKKDFLLISCKLKATEINENDSKAELSETSIAEKTANKLNPSGGLPEELKNETDGYNVEFWVSPVNYRGYKLFENKLILFGIEEPDAVRLYLKENKLIMKYGNDFYILEPSYNYESFVLANEIPTSIK